MTLLVWFNYGRRSGLGLEKFANCFKSVTCLSNAKRKTNSYLRSLITGKKDIPDLERWVKDTENLSIARSVHFKLDIKAKIAV